MRGSLVLYRKNSISLFGIILGRGDWGVIGDLIFELEKKYGILYFRILFNNGEVKIIENSHLEILEKY